MRLTGGSTVIPFPLRRRAFVMLTPAALARRLGLADDIVIAGVEWDFHTQTIRIFFRGTNPRLPVVPEMGQSPRVSFADVQVDDYAAQ